MAHQLVQRLAGQPATAVSRLSGNYLLIAQRAASQSVGFISPKPK